MFNRMHNVHDVLINKVIHGRQGSTHSSAIPSPSVVTNDPKVISKFNDFFAIVGPTLAFPIQPVARTIPICDSLLFFSQL